MLVFVSNPQRAPDILGNCDLALPPSGLYQTITYQCPHGNARQSLVGYVGFSDGRKNTIGVVVLAPGEDPYELPGFREADGRA